MSKAEAEGRAIFIVAPGGLRDSAGIGRLLSSLIRHWSENGGPAFRIVDSYGPGITVLSPLYLVRAMAEVLWHGLRGHIALLHIHMATRGSVARKTMILRLARSLRLPAILHLHGQHAFHHRLPRFASRFAAEAMRGAAAVVVLGEVWRHLLCTETGIDPQRIHILHNAVSGPAVPPRREVGRPCQILFLGRLVEEKGVAELLDALADERLAELEWQARLAGAGEVERYRNQVLVNRLSGRVEVSGWLSEPQVRRWLADTDVFVLPSHAEGMSVAVLEAMAFGAAVITTPVGSNAEAVIDGVSGLLVQAGSRGDLVAALLRVITDPDLRRRLQIGARRRFEECFDIAEHSRRLQGLYAEVLQRHGDEVAT